MAGIASCLGVKTGIRTIGVAIISIYCCGGWTSRAVSKLSYLRPSVKLFNLRNQSSCQNNPNEDSILCVQTALFDPKIAPTSVPIQINMSDDNSLVAELSRFYIGLGVPMEASVEAGNIQMCGLVGHEGRLKPCKASKNAIFISPRHRVYLQDAVSITALLSLARIPEPVRQADLLGRSFLREKAVR